MLKLLNTILLVIEPVFEIKVIKTIKNDNLKENNGYDCKF